MFDKIRATQPSPNAKPRIDDGQVSALHLKLAQFATIGSEDAAALSRALTARVQTVSAGVDLIESGQASTELLVILSGWACSSRADGSGSGQIVALHLPGDLCDFGALLKQRSDCTINALTDLQVAAISRAMLSDLSSLHAPVMQALWWESMCACSTRGEWISRLARRSARERLSSLICELATRLFAVGLADDAGFSLPLTQAKLGCCCGLTTEHTNRTLRQLRDEGIIAMDDGNLRLMDWDRLRAIAAFRPDFLHFRDLREEAMPVPTPAVL